MKSALPLYVATVFCALTLAGCLAATEADVAGAEIDSEIGRSSEALVNYAVFSTVGSYSLPVCATSSSTCPGRGKVVTVELWGGGGGGGGGASRASQFGGAGGGGGGAGGFVRYKYAIPSNGSVIRLGGVVGAGGNAGSRGGASGGDGAQGGYSSFVIYRTGGPVGGDGLLYAQAGTGGQGGQTITDGTNYWSEGGHRGIGGGAGNVILAAPPGAGGIFAGPVPNNVTAASGTDGEDGLFCSGGGYGSGGAPIALWGGGGTGGGGGFRHLFPNCMSHSNDDGLGDGLRGGQGLVRISW